MANKITIITGGSSGLGLELAKLHRDNGQNICILGRSIEKLHIAREKLLKIESKGEIIIYSCNISSEESISELFSDLNNRGFEPENVYNNAGVGLFSSPYEVTQDQINKLIEANFIGLILVSTAAIKAMKISGGNIINIMSTAAKKSKPLESVYCGVKWGARGYTQALGAAMDGTKTKVLAVYPGGMNTDFWNDNGLNPDLSRFMKPKDVAVEIFSNLPTSSTKNFTELDITRS